ncbi:MAG: hypothetical protein HOV83_05165, partial [Catenulispora sp.]|nr:hypothetical protein [Catenulispora sp.]
MNGDLSRHWRALIAAAAPGVAASWLLTTIVSLVAGGGTTALVGGRVETGPGEHQWALLGLAVGGWVYAVVAVMIVAAGAVTGTPIPVRAALRHAARRWLAAVGVLALLAVYAIVLLLGVAFLSFGSVWFAVVLVVVAAVLLSRFTYALPAAAIDGLPGLPVATPPRPAARDEPWDPDKPAGSPPVERFTSADALRIGLRLADGYKTGVFFLFVAVVLVAWGQSWLIDRL